MAQTALTNFSYDTRTAAHRNMTTDSSNGTEQSEQDQVQLFDPMSYNIMVVAFFSAIFAFGLVGNASLLGTILRRKKLRNPCGLLLANIALADLGVAVIAAPLRIAELYYIGWPFGSALCRLIPPLQDVMVCVSVVTHSTIALERYRATVTPFKARPSSGKTRCVIFGIWLFCYMFGGLPLTFPLKLETFEGVMYCFPDWTTLYRRVYETYLVVIFIVVQLVIQSYAYISIIRALKSKSEIISMVAAKTESMVQSGTSFDSRVSCKGMAASMKRKQKLVKMLLVLVITFQICHLPRGITMLYREFADPYLIGPTFEYLDLIALALYYLKHVINPFILYAMSADLRNGVKMCCCKHGKGTENFQNNQIKSTFYSVPKQTVDFDEERLEEDEIEQPL